MLRRVMVVVCVAGFGSCCIRTTQRPSGVAAPSIPPGPPRWDAGVFLIGGGSYAAGFQAADASIGISAGPQGGYHIDLWARQAGAFEASLNITTRATRTSDGVLVGTGGGFVEFSATDAGTFDSRGSVRVFLCPTPAGVSALGEPLRFEAWAQNGEAGPLLGYDTFEAAVTGCDFTSCQSDCSGVDP